MLNLCGYASKWLDLQDEPAKTKVPGSMGVQILGHNKAYIYVYLDMLTSSSIHCIDMAMAIAEISQYQVEKGADFGHIQNFGTNLCQKFGDSTILYLYKLQRPLQTNSYPRMPLLDVGEMFVIDMYPSWLTSWETDPVIKAAISLSVSGESPRSPECWSSARWKGTFPWIVVSSYLSQGRMEWNPLNVSWHVPLVTSSYGYRFLVLLSKRSR